MKLFRFREIQRGVQRGSPLWQEVWGLRPQFP